ncbi:ankyrin-2 isoform X3 [Musca domestica]|uniref:Ankyrin-2 isoform X3 n=1 Tax=Musca domestica TaxID=7370 RepID=A0ABM3VPZ3_MUSDO|nr:ankyrin-2 isoform X3 [Musca domestica]
MAQFVTHIQPTLMEASQGHVPHHHAHQVGVQHSSHLPHSGHNMPSPPTAHNHHQIHHQQQQHHSNHHGHQGSVSSPPGGHHHHHQQQHQHHPHQQQQHHQQQHHHSNHGPGKQAGAGGKHEHCPSGHQSSGDGNTSFLRAARAGNMDKVLEHLKNNIDINTSNANGLNALHLASKDGHVHVVSELLRRGAIVDSATKKGNTALHIASLAGQEEVVKLLLQHGASVNVQSQNGFTPLYMAAQENHDSVVKLLLSNGANQSLATEDGFTPLAVAMQQGHDKVVAVLLESDTRGKVRLPALHIAAKKDDVKAATLLLDNDHNPDVTSKSGFTPLHIASHYGNQAIANLLIQKGADVNFSAKHNISPLHVAAKWGKTNMVSLLLEKGANIEAKTRDGLTPLHCAARSGHEQVVDMLLERGAPISAKTKNGLAPLHMAAQGEHVDAARILLYHRAPVDEVTVDYLTALHVAAHCGHVRVAKLLLDRNADANARALNGFTPLHIACKKNRIKVVELLLRHGASISATTESGLTPLHVAAFMGCMNIVIYLLQHDASPDVPTVRGETPLHLAARANQTDIIRILLRNGAQVDARAREQQTPLHIASRLGNVDIVMLLLQHGAQVDATTKDMYTALHIAAKEGQDEVAAVLIENGAALDAATKKGFTPLHLTAKYGHIKVAQLLLQKEADVDAQGKNGVTPLHVACHYDNQNVALLLLEKGASPHATAKNGHTPLHIAARKNQMDIATTLLEYGAQANAESKAGFTPLHLSCQEGHTEISNLLIEHKAGVNHPAKNGLTPMHLCAQEDNVNVAEILQRNGANIDMATKAGYTPLHVAAHFGQANMVRFLLQHGANVNSATSIGYTPLHQSAQQGHCHIVKLLLEHNADANAQTSNGQTPLDIARKLGYISVLDSLKSYTNDPEGSAQVHSDEKYRVVAPEAMHESFMSDSEEEGGEDNMLSDQPYRYLTVDEMKSLGDDSLPIDVTRDERVDSNRMAQSAEYTNAGLQQQQQQPQPAVESAISPQKAQTYNAVHTKTMRDGGIYISNDMLNGDDHQHEGRKLQWKSFLVSFLVDARGGAMRGCRHSGVRMIIPSRSTAQPTRVTCRYVKPQRTMHPPQLMEGEALASRVLELGPVSTKFIGPVIMEVPHFASLRGKEREIIILRSDNGETWREHTIENSEEIIHDVLQQCFEPEEIAQLEEQAGNHVCRFVTYDFPQYFAVVTRIRQEVHAIGPEGGMVSSTVVPQVQAVFPQGALTKKIKVGLQAQPVDPDLTAKLLGRGVAVSPIVTVEPRRRKFHKAITLSMPAPKAHSQGMINQYSGNTPTLRLLCSITGGPSRAQWEDVTGSTPLTFVNDCVSFTTTVSARFWLMDCRNISEATKMATELYKEVIHVPFIAKFVVFAKKVEPYEARLRVFCMTDDREDKTLEKMELYTQVAKSRDVEVLEGKPQYIEMAGNLVPVTKSGEQLQLPFKAFRENRLPFTVRVKDQHADIVGRTLFMKEPKVAKGEPPQQPICILNIVLPEAVIPDSVTAFSDKVTPTYRSSLLNFSKHQNDHYIGDIRIVDLSNLLGKDWIQLATEIGISTEEIDEIINQNTDSIARQAQSMIRLYKDKPNYDLPALEQALKNIGRDDIMSKCKSGRLSHSRDFDETDIMKNSESVEELVRQESKRIQQIHEREEIKYSAEEKEIEESESDEECVKRSVAERRDKIVKRLSVERQIPASSQKKEISREITEIKRKSLIDDKKAIHESEIMMQLPADNIVKSAVVPEQVIKMKMGKKDSCEVSKSDFDKELTHKFKTSSRSSEEEDDTSSAAKSLSSHEEVDNSKIVKDISSVEKPSKIIDSLKSEQPSLASGTKQLTQDFLAFEKFTQLPSQQTTAVPEKFVGEVKDKSQEVVQTAHEIVSETVETASKKVENIISAFETKKPENGLAEPLATKSTSKIIDETAERIQDSIIADQKSAADAVKSFSETKVDETKEFLLTESESVKDKIKAFTEPKIAEAKDTSSQFAQGVGKAKEFIENESSSAAESVKSGASQVQDKLSAGFDKLGQMFAGAKKTVESEVKETSETIETKANETKSETKEKIEQGIAGTKDFIVTETKTVTETIKTFSEPVKIEEKLTEAKDSVKTEANNVADAIKSFTDKAGAAIDGVQSKIKKEQVVASDKIDQTIADFEAKKVTYEFRGLEPKVTPTTTSLEQEPTSVPEAAPRKTVSTLDDSREKLEEMKSIVADARKLTRDFLSMEQESQLPKPRSDIVEETKQIEKTTVETITFPPVVETTIKEGNDLLMKGSETLHTAKQQIDKHVDEAKQIVDDGIEIAAPITKPEITTSSVKTLTQDFLSFEQAGPMHVTSSSEPRKSLTDAEFCKSVEETITKKMSEGLIEISEQLKLEESDIPHSQTPPPTPIETKNEKSEYAEGTQKATIDEDNLIDTVKTLHKTTESTFERITTISTTETLQEIVPEAQTVTVESVTRQGTITYDTVNEKQPTKVDDADKYNGGAEDEDDDDDDDDEEDDRNGSVIGIDSKLVAFSQSNQLESVRLEATVLVDRVLEESIHIVNEQHDASRDAVLGGHDNGTDNVNNALGVTSVTAGEGTNRQEYNSESENYAITCDVVGGVDVVKSPTIESMSGKSFDDNLSSSDDQQQPQHSMGPPEAPFQSGDDKRGAKITVQTPQAKERSSIIRTVEESKRDDDGEQRTATRTRRIEYKFEKISSKVEDVDVEADKFDDQFGSVVADDEISNLQGEFSKLSWDDSLSPTTNTLADIGQNTPDNDILDIVAETGGEVSQSTDITPVPPPPAPAAAADATATATVTTEIPMTATITSAATVATETVGEVPKPKPRLAKASSPEKDEAQPIAALEDAIELETSQDSRTSPAPVPKPRSQIKTSDSYKNLTALDDSSSQTKTPQLVQQTDSVSVRSFDLTEETSHMDDTSASQNLENVVTTSATTNTTSDDPATESNELTSDLSIDTSVVGGDRKTSFYIGESSQNIIIKTTPTKLSAVDDDDDQGDPMGIMGNQPIAATDISLMKEISVDSEEDNDVFKEYVTIKTTEPAARIRRQSSETRNDLLEEDVLPKEETEGASSFVAGATSESFEADSKKEKTATVDSTPKTKEDDTVCEMSIDSEEVSIERPTELDLSLEKSEWEMTEKEIPPQGKSKVEHSPQQPTQTVLTKESITEELVAKTLDEVQESLEAAKNELKSVLKDGKSIKESPSEFEFRSFSQTISERFGDVAEQGLKTGKIIEENIEMVETEDISSFIGVPETLQIQREEHQHQIEGLFESSVPETLDRAAAMMHYAQSHIAEGKSDADKEDRASLGFISTGTDDYVEETVAKQEHASLGFVSNETVEEFSSMEDYYQEKLAKADVVESREETTQHAVTSFEEISSERTMKPFDDVVHRVKPDGVDTSQNRWSVPEVEQSSSSESYYKSFEKSESRPLSSDVDNLATQCTSEYKTAAEGSSTYRETTEYMSAASTLDSLSGKTISSHESMRSFDSHSETSANLISMDSSELTETLVASSTDEADEIEHLRDLLDEEDSEESLDLEAAGYALPENAMQQQPMMKRSQEMIFKPKTEDAAAIMSDDPQPKEMQPETAPIPVGQSKPKEVEKTWGLSYPLEESKPEDNRDTEDILLYHGDVRKSVDESKYASSLDEGSILSVSMSSTSNIDTVVENFEDTVGSFGASSLAGIEGFGGSSLPDETTFVMEMEGSTDYSPEECSATTPPDANQSKRGHKRSESEVESAEETQAIPDKETPAGSIGEGKESGSESDTDPYETEYARQFRSPTDRKNNKKKKQAAAEMDHSFETEKRPFTPSQLVAEVIVEDVATEELEAEASMIEDRRPSQNMLDYSNIPDITVTEDTQQKSPILEEEENADKFEEKILYKVKTQEELHKVTDDRPIYQEQPLTDLKEENFQKLVQEQYKQKLAELQKADIGDSDYDENKAPDSPDSFEMVDQPDISDDFVIIEEVAKEANEDDLGGKSIRIKPTKYEPKHDEEVEKIIIKSAPADPMLGSQIFRDDLNFEFEESPPTASSGGTGSEVQEESDSGSDMAATNKRWVEMQLTDNQLRYPYELTGGVLEDIKEEDGEFEVGSSRISSFKDSFSSTPEYDVLAARRYYGRGEHDDVSMSSLQEFESLEQAISLENRNRTHQGSTDSSNGSFQRRYLIRHSASGTAPGDDISISSLKEFEGLENACIEAHLIEIKAKEEAAMLSRSDESNKSNSSDRDQGADSSNVVVSKVTRTVTHTEVLTGQNSPDIEALLKQKLQECEQGQSGIRLTQQQILDLKFKGDSDRGSIESLEMNKSIEMGSSSADDSYDMSKDATRSDIDSLEVDKPQLTREESIESADMQQIDDLMSKFGATIGEGLTTTTTTTTTSTDAEGHEHTTVTRRVVTTTTTLAGSGPSSTSLDQQLAQTLVKDISADSLNQMSTVEQTTTTSSAGTTATYQTSAGNSQMSGSITSCASSILMEDSTNSIATFNITSTATTTQFSTTDPNQPAHPVSGTDDAALKKDEVRR